MRNSKTLELFESFKKEFEKEDEVLTESKKEVLKEWDSSVILDAMYRYADVVGEDPDWNDVIETIIRKLPQSKWNKFLKDNGVDEEEFWETIDDVDSVISNLESYLTKKQAEEIAKIYEPEEADEDEEEFEESEVLTEKRNPENDEANDLIRKALNDPEFAKTHAQELRKHGIKYLKPSEEWGDNGALEGKEGRRLAINTDPNWRKDDIDYSTGRFMNDKAVYQKDYSRDDTYADQKDLHQKTYVDSKAALKHAKDNINKQAKKVAKIEDKNKEAGIKFSDKLYKEKGILNNYKNRIEQGITADYKNTTKIHPDTDLKGFLNAKKHSDRPLPREKDPKYRRANDKVADPANKDVEDYKANQYEKKDINREKEYNSRQDQEDKERIEQMKQRAKEEKTRRDSYINKRQKEVDKVDKKISSKLDAFRKRMANK